MIRLSAVLPYLAIPMLLAACDSEIGSRAVLTENTVTAPAPGAALVSSASQCASGQPNILVNGSFELTTNPAYSSAAELVSDIGRTNNGIRFVDRHPETDFPGWFATGGLALIQGGFSQGGTLELGLSGFLGADAPDGDVIVEMDGNVHNQIVSVTPGQILDWEFSHRGRNGTDSVSITIGPAGQQTLEATVDSPFGFWSLHTGQYEVPDGVSEIQLSITPVGASDGDIDSSNLLDDVKLCIAPGSGDANLALNQPTSQSTTDFGGNSSRAVDGNTNGDWRANSITHTLRGNPLNPWWRVDLGASYDISQINVFNRTNCCSTRLDGAVVYVGNIDSSDPTDYTAVGSLTGSTTVQSFTATNTVGRYVMVQIEGPGILSLAEVEIFGAPVLLENVALNQFSVQSTTGHGGVASRAVDGDTNGIWIDGSVTHTQSLSSNNPWWRVDLGASYDISRIEIFNRTDNCCAFRLDGATVYVGDINSSNPADYNTVGSLTGSSQVQTITGVNTTGRYVMVRIEGLGILSLAEVEVFATTR